MEALPFKICSRRTLYDRLSYHLTILVASSIIGYNFSISMLYDLIIVKSIAFIRRLKHVNEHEIV